MKQHATQPTSRARQGLLNIQERINQKPWLYSKKSLDNDLKMSGYDVTTIIQDLSKTLGMHDFIGYEQRNPLGLLMFINRVLEETTKP